MENAEPVISLVRYRDLQQARDVREIFAASFIGRLPIGITGLALLLFVQSSLGSFAQGGAAAACYVGGLSCGTLLGRMIDRYGPRAACCLRRLRCFLALIAFVWAVEPRRAGPRLRRRCGCDVSTDHGLHAPLPPAPPAGWHHCLLMESVLIELIFILGPVLVSLFVALASPATAVYSRPRAAASARFSFFVRGAALEN
jgi:hypothetical protein